MLLASARARTFPTSVSKADPYGLAIEVYRQKVRFGAGLWRGVRAREGLVCGANGARRQPADSRLAIEKAEGVWALHTNRRVVCDLGNIACPGAALLSC